MKNLFVYGTLMNDEIVKALCGKRFKKSPATISGFIASNLNGRHSPGLSKKANSTVEGYVLHSVDSRSFNIIKAWENDDYKLIKVKPNNGAFGVCNTFLWKTDILGTVWDNARFRKYHMQWYLDVDIPKFLNNGMINLM